MLKVGIIGYGTIGEDVVDAIRRGEAGKAQLAAILVRDRTIWQQHELAPFFVDSLENFKEAGPQVVVECAGHEAVCRYGQEVLHSGADLIVVSVGAFADDALLKSLKTTAERSERRIIVPSAAIGGLDRIAAGSVGPMEAVTLITRKPPQAWYGTMVEQKVDLAHLTEPYCVFEGLARDSARLFPESVNVSAALSLAGVGLDETQVKVYVDPGITHNTHEIEARGKFGQIKLQIQNTPSARNPKTGYIVAMSVVKAIRDMTSAFVIGI